MIAIISECWANYGFGEVITQNLSLKVKRVHAEGITKVGKKLRSFVKRGFDKFILVMDLESNTQVGEWVKGFLKNMEKSYNVSSFQISRAISIKKYKNGERIMIILFDPFIEEAFIRKYDKEVEQKRDKYKCKEGKDLIVRLIKDKNPEEVDEIKGKIFRFFS